MGVLTGTSGNDTLYGGAWADVFHSLGGSDRLVGYGGADTYDLDFQLGYGALDPVYVIKEGASADGAVDTITGLVGLLRYDYGAQTYDYLTFLRSGATGEHLRIITYDVPRVFTTPGYSAGVAQVVSQYDRASSSPCRTGAGRRGYLFAGAGDCRD